MRSWNVQSILGGGLTCNIDFSNSFYYLFFSFVLIELKPFVLKGKALGEKLWKSVKKCENYETILPFSCCPLVSLIYAWNFQSRLEIFNLDCNFQSRLKISIPTLMIPHKKGPCCVARLKLSISIENFNPRLVAWKFQSWSEILNFFNLWALWVSGPLSRLVLGPVSRNPDIHTKKEMWRNFERDTKKPN